MADQLSRPAWMNDELVKDIPREKLDFVNKLFAEANARRQAAGSMRSQKEMLMLMMPLLQQAKASNLSFTPQELQAAVAAIRKYSTAEELQQIDKIYSQHIKPNQKTD